MKKLTLKGFLKKRRDEDESYPVKHLGTVLCSHPDKDEICRAMAEMYTVSRQKIKRLPLYNLTVSSREIKLQKAADVKEGSVKKFVITRIVYCGVDKQHQKLFAFFYRSAESIYGALDCHVVECRSKRDAKRIALMISEIFEEMASEKRDETPETNTLCESNAVQDRTLSMIQLHMSVESLIDDEKDDRCGSPTIQRFKPPNERRKLNYSDLQLHLTKCENNSSGYGDSSEHLSNEKVKMIKQGKVQVRVDGGESSQTGQVKMDYVNAEIAGSSSSSRGIFKRNSGSILKPFASQPVGFTKIKECGESLKKDRNGNLFEYKTFEYMNIDTDRSDETGEFV